MIDDLRVLSLAEAGELNLATRMVRADSLLDSATCDDASPIANIDVSPGETVTCTFTNIKRGSIAVAKVSVPAGLSDLFSFSGDLNGQIASGGQLTNLSVQPGQYSVTESDPTAAGFKLESVGCDDGNSTGDGDSRTATFNVEPGENVICTFTNSTGAILVTKEAKNKSLGSGLHPQSGVEFTLSGGHLGTPLSNNTDSNGEVCYDRLVPDQSYDVTETVPNGYALANLIENPQNVLVTAGATCETGAPDARLLRERSAIQINCRLQLTRWTRRNRDNFNKLHRPSGL